MKNEKLKNQQRKVKNIFLDKNLKNNLITIETA